MNRIFNQFKKDLAHQRWALAGWATLLLIHLLVSGFQILHHVPNPQASTEQFADTVASWAAFGPLLFVLLVVQADSPVGTAAFWLTRPLRGARMLAAKGLFVFLFFVLLPLGIEIIILLLRGAGTSAWLAVPEFSVVRLPVVMGAFALGAATQRFLHALTLGAIGAALSAATMLLGYFIFHGAPGGSPSPPFSGSRGIVTLWALATVFTTVAVMQFLTRRQGLSRCLLAVGISGAMILHSIWDWNILDRSPQREDGSPTKLEVRVDPTSITIDTYQNSSRTGLPKHYVSMPIEIGSGNLAAGKFLAPVTSRIELITGSSSNFKGTSTYGVVPASQNYRAALVSIFLPSGLELVSNGDLSVVENRLNPLRHSLAMDDAQFGRLDHDLEEIRLAIDVGEFEFSRAGELPFKDGAVWRDQGDELEILQILKQGHALEIKIREQQLSMIFSARNAYGRYSSYPWVLVLINPKAGTAILLNRNDSPVLYRGASWISPFLRRKETLYLDLRQALGARPSPEAVEQWFRDSTLAIVRKRNLGSIRVHHVVDTHNIQLNHPTTP
jgi:hypothetical protein